MTVHCWELNQTVAPIADAVSELVSQWEKN